MTVKNATELVVHIENTLGWTPDTDRMPLWKARAVEAGKLNAAIRKNPKLLTWVNLELAVEYLRRKRQPVKSPVGVTYFVEKALDKAHQEASRPLGELVDEALRAEYSRNDDLTNLWVTRLIRAEGNARAEVYAEWQQERG